jgi:L-fuconolactonase
MDPAWSVVTRDFTPDDFAAVRAGTDVTGSVLVQNFQTEEETAELVAAAAAHASILGVVGWFPLKDPAIGERLDEVRARSPKVCGARVILQGTAPGEFFGDPDFHRGLRALADRGLTYDLLINERQLEAAIALVDAHPNLVFVLDHLGKPEVRARTPATWAGNFRALARRDHVYCKLSGLPFEGDWAAWTLDDIRPYAEVALASFGPDRLMFGSDWPVCLLATSYRRWVGTVETLLAPLAPAERASIWDGTARRAYRLGAG